MILNEVLRLYLPAMMFTRLTTRETTLGQTTLLAKVQLMLPILALHHDKEVWGDDVEDFNPERFKEGVSKATKGDVSFFPFGWGPRTCIAQNFAMLEAKMTLVMILQCFAFELSPSYTHASHTVVTLQPQHDAYLSLRKL
ncbi:oxygenase [Lithospermum erythrorhizon]|uniref:Oxygenase n=1 Tax=Lithospermum erythrorhizon TaxID=34254 RepID=A0AAV3NXX9_LITER